ncbi:hypothetical protein IEO21_09432 [Rhodonia placenta]|uniref:Uncharacterized protein n=1 Tax=Rhodonia placenta TaxID=104341 RepID=A0A8H7NUI3_9APHY|nr:hypothetical protein IEO21_09432 [Postia placenta]
MFMSTLATHGSNRNSEVTVRPREHMDVSSLNCNMRPWLYMKADVGEGTYVC